MARCPICDASISMSAPNCTRCAADFGKNSVLLPVAETAAEREQLIELGQQRALPPEQTSPSSKGAEPSISGFVRFANALVWAFVSSVVMYVVALNTPDFVGAGGGALEGLWAAGFSLMAAFFAFMITLALPSFGKFIPLLIVVVYPAWYYLEMPARKRAGAQSPTLALAPLTGEERERLKSTHFDVRVVVAPGPPGSPPEAYQTSLVHDFNRPGLFKEVGKIGEVNSPDLIATPIDIYYGSKQKSWFSLHWSSQPEQKVYVRVFGYSPDVLRKNPGMLSYIDQTLYQDRLALNVIDAINKLKMQSASANALIGLRPLAEQGNADAQTKIGDMYRTGQGVVQNHAEALKWYQQAAAQGNALAQVGLGMMYEGRHHVRPNHVEAIKWYKLAAAQGNASAQLHLGMIYESPIGVAPNNAEAIKWYQLAAAQGDPSAQTILGRRYAFGERVAQDYAEAMKWYRLAAAQGSKDAQVGLGVMYESGHGVAQDYVRAHMWFNLGSMNRARDNVAKNMTVQQVAEAEKMARECQQRNFKGCD